MSHQNRRGQRRTCGAADYHQERIEADEEYRRADQQIEDFTREYVERRRERGEGLRGHVVTIPVVVHVVYNNSSQNISNTQIQSQIDTLNRDFRSNNADVTDTPSDFQPVVADTRIQFELARRDPDCQPTNGITRTETDEEWFMFDGGAGSATDRNPVKFDTTGGKNGWPPDEYLNIWVCPEIRAPGIGAILGYASWPAEYATSPAEDGVVIDYRYFGTTGTATAPFDLGRTAVHEVGHWLNLKHIWGNTRFECSEDDDVSDTPQQYEPNFGCPTHPSPSCSNGGDMFMNYMDYVNDSCMVMFTAGQSDRMAAALFGPRADIVGSEALLEPSGDADLWMQDTPDDRAEEPNTESHVMYRSNDIWVRQTNDGFDQQQHQNPVYRSMGDKRNYVYVRVRCDGCVDEEAGTLKLYWAKASTMLRWPEPWDGSVTSPAQMGDIIDSQPTGAIDAGDHRIFEFSWEPPNPADYASFGADRGHFCLLARIETESTPPYGMAFSEGSNLSENVRNNNNIVWKNISVMTETPTGGRSGSVIVGGVLEEEIEMRLQVDFEQETKFVPLFERGRIYVDLGEELYERWAEIEFHGENVEPYRTGFLLARPSGWIGDIEVRPEDLWAVDVTFEPRDELNRTELAFVDLTQYAVRDGDPDVVGGQRFTIQFVGELEPRPEPRPPLEVDQELLLQWLQQVFLRDLNQLTIEMPSVDLTDRPFLRPEVREEEEEGDSRIESRSRHR